MIFVIICYLIFILLLNKMIFSDTLQRKVLNGFFIIWCVNLLISSINPYNLFEVKDSTYLIVLLSLTFFLLGSLAKNSINVKKNKLDLSKFLQSTSTIRRNKIILIILLISIYQIGEYYLKYQQVVLAYGAEGARLYRFFVGPLFSSTGEIFIYNYYFETLAIFCVLYFAISLVFEKLNILSILCIIYCYLFSNIGAGRFFLVETSLYILLIFLTKKYYFKISTSRYTVSILTLLVAFLYCLSIYFVNFRRGIFEISLANIISGNEILLEQSIIYNIGSINALDYGLTNNDYVIDNTIFRLYFGGLDEIFSTCLNFLGIIYTSANSIYGNLTFIPIKIGFNQDFNALYTNIYLMYVDFGLLGIVICSFVNGYMFNLVYKWFKNYPNIYNLLIFIFFTVQMYLSIFNWGFSSSSSWIFCIVCLIMSKWKKQKLYF